MYTITSCSKGNDFLCYEFKFLFYVGKYITQYKCFLSVMRISVGGKVKRYEGHKNPIHSSLK